MIEIMICLHHHGVDDDQVNGRYKKKQWSFVVKKIYGTIKKNMDQLFDGHRYRELLIFKYGQIKRKSVEKMMMMMMIIIHSW